MKREELLKRTKKELLALAGEKGARLSSKLRKADLVEQILGLVSRRGGSKSAGATTAAEKKPTARAPRVAAGLKRRAKEVAAGLRPSRRAKAGIEPEELHRISEEIGRLFPPPVENTEIVLYEIDPFHAHVFWHVRYDEMEAARRGLGPEGEHAALILRYYDVTLIQFDGFNAHYHFDVAVHSLRSNFYLDFWESGRSYIVDIGLRTHDGRFALLARSNHIELPPHAPSANFDRTGIVVDGKLNVICEVADVTRAETLADIRPEPRPEMEAETSDELVRTFYQQLTDQGLPPLNRRVQERLQAGPATGGTGGASAAALPGAVMAPSELPGNLGPEHCGPESFGPESYGRVRSGAVVEAGGERMAGSQGGGVSIAYVEGGRSETEGGAGKVSVVNASSYLIQGGVARPGGVSSWAVSGSGVSSWVTSPGVGAGEAGVLGEVLTLPPAELGRAGKLRDFYAELILQGRVEPGARLQMLGETVRVRPDGTFYIRRRLGEGTLVVPVTLEGGREGKADDEAEPS